MTKELKWRLSKLPTPDELRELVKDKIITQDEAREILFNFETEEDRDKKSLESEIKFLRELVEKLSENRTKIVEVIKEIQRPYYIQPWYNPYHVWCTTSATGGNTYTTTNTSGGTNALQLSGTSSTGGHAMNFSSIKTF
mgnify:CR=1 FL=1